MKKMWMVSIAVAALITTTSVVYAQTFRLYTLSGFVEMLVERGIVPQTVAERARAIVRLLEHAEEVQESPVTVRGRNAESVEVTVSQFIEHANLMFQEGEDIRDLLLLVTNTGTSSVELEAKRGCQVVYRIFDDTNTLLYDSATTEKCRTDERVTYMLKGNDTRMFEVRHRMSDFALQKGIYSFELDYPEYGSGTLIVTIE